MLACGEGGYKASGRSERQQSRLIAMPMQSVRLSTLRKGFFLVLEGFDGVRQLVADVEARDKRAGKRWYSRRSRRWGHYELNSPVWLSGASSDVVCGVKVQRKLTRGRVRLSRQSISGA